MRLSIVTSLFPLLGLFTGSALSLAVAHENALSAFCQSPTVVSETFIGKDKNVKVQSLRCDDIVPLQDVSARDGELERRQTNVCGAPCTTNCFTPSGGGPDPNECHVITDALLFDSQNIGPLFTLNPANNTAVITMTYSSCTSFMVNQAGIPLQYCRSDWASVLDFVAFNCQATQNAHGGNCVANNQQWFIQVNHS
ncbi:hypothetical protein ABKN59_008334 [Abortiporus biennis]